MSSVHDQRQQPNEGKLLRRAQSDNKKKENKVRIDSDAEEETVKEMAFAFADRVSTNHIIIFLRNQ